MERMREEKQQPTVAVTPPPVRSNKGEMKTINLTQR